ncbi:unnamed protein product [Rangifer tarandus platyrhynchus]|uniref:Uncharacterized protein n=1 Tax=Rangifer tarandus platyrhynchus TaxID=3082113 RepID=A0AC59ZQF5_RANTA
MGTGSDHQLELCRRAQVLAQFWQSQAGPVTPARLAWVPLRDCGPPSQRLTKSQCDTLRQRHPSRANHLKAAWCFHASSPAMSLLSTHTVPPSHLFCLCRSLGLAEPRFRLPGHWIHTGRLSASASASAFPDGAEQGRKQLLRFGE